MSAALATAGELLVGPLAVRSSATDEDGGRSSLAGMHDTVLGVMPAELPQAVQRCWASLWSERAVSYRRERGLSLNGEMAVVLQPLVPAQMSAVAFSCDPVGVREDTLLVSCTAGSGDEMMAGGGATVTFTVDKPSARIREVDGDCDAGDELADRCARVLDALIDTVVFLERSFDMAVDVEAVHDGQCWSVVQCRAITT